jgi:hypothetical protein
MLHSIDYFNPPGAKPSVELPQRPTHSADLGFLVEARTPGVLQTATPSCVARRTSILSAPTAMLATTRSRPAAPPSSTSASMRSVSVVRIPSTPPGGSNHPAMGLVIRREDDKLVACKLQGSQPVWRDVGRN